jgi:hypothetical protein
MFVSKGQLRKGMEVHLHKDGEIYKWVRVLSINDDSIELLGHGVSNMVMDSDGYKIWDPARANLEKIKTERLCYKDVNVGDIVSFNIVGNTWRDFTVVEKEALVVTQDMGGSSSLFIKTVSTDGVERYMCCTKEADGEYYAAAYWANPEKMQARRDSILKAIK